MKDGELLFQVRWEQRLMVHSGQVQEWLHGEPHEQPWPWQGHWQDATTAETYRGDPVHEHLEAHCGADTGSQQQPTSSRDPQLQPQPQQQPHEAQQVASANHTVAVNVPTIQQTVELRVVRETIQGHPPIPAAGGIEP